MKLCTKCKATKKEVEFHKNKSNKSGLSDWCRDCNNSTYSELKKQKVRDRYWADPEKARERQALTRDKAKHREKEKERRQKYNLRSDLEIQEHRAKLRPENLKRCRKCRLELSFTMFHPNRGLPDGLTADCRQCVKLSKRKLEKIADFESRHMSYCVYCGSDYEDIDHVFPVKLGGLDIKENLVPSCSRCNKIKSAKHPEEWLSQVFPGENIDNLLREWGIVKTWENH